MKEASIKINKIEVTDDTQMDTEKKKKHTEKENISIDNQDDNKSLEEKSDNSIDNQEDNKSIDNNINAIDNITENIKDITVNYKKLNEIDDELHELSKSEEEEVKEEMLERLKREYKMKKKEKFFTKLVKNVFMRNNIKKNKNYREYECNNKVEFNNIYLQTECRTVLGCYLFAPKNIKEETNILLCIHGIRDDRETFAENIDVENMVEMDNIVFIVDYQGFGDSSGEFIVEEVANNMKIAINYLYNKYKRRINVVGHSIGCAIILDYYYRVSVEDRMADGKHRGIIKKIVLLSPFKSTVAVLEEFKTYKLLTRIVPRVHNDISTEFNYDNMKNIEVVDSRDIIVFHGTADYTVPFECGLAVANKIGCKIYRAHNDDHKSILRNPEVWIKIDKFVREE